MARYRDKLPLDRVIQEGLLWAERKQDSRCVMCGNIPDGKDLEGQDQTFPGTLDVISGEWLCFGCDAEHLKGSSDDGEAERG